MVYECRPPARKPMSPGCPDNGDVDARQHQPVGPPPGTEITNERLVLSLRTRMIFASGAIRGA